MKPKLFILILLLFAFSACKEKEKHSKERSMNDPGVSDDELKKAILSKGDTAAYQSLDIAYLDYSYKEEFLLYALVMANKYDYPQAYFDVFFCLTQTFSNNFGNIDETTATMAVDYLLKASEKGHDQAKEMVEEFSVKRNPGHNKEQIERIFKE